jgi:tetratricopeptide (TPR) repeat protein
VVRDGPERCLVRKQGRRLRRPPRLHEKAEDALSSEEAVAATVERGDLLIDAGRKQEAADLISRALAQHPDDEDLLAVLARAQLGVDDRAALETATRVIAVMPGWAHGHVLASIAADNLGLKDEAERHARQAIELAPWSAGGYIVLVDAIGGRRGRRDEAAEAAEKTVEIDPANPAGHLCVGNVCMAYGDWAGAEAAYLRALEIDPDFTTAQANLAQCRHMKGVLGDAMLDVDTLLRLDPQDASARLVLDEIIYTMFVHAQWVVFALAFVALVFRQWY